MRTRTEGLALIAALGMMVVLILVVGLLSVSAVSDLQQSRASIQLTQARALAEAGEVYGRYAIANPAREDMRNLLRPNMSTIGVDPTKDWIISSSLWSGLSVSLENLLNSGYGTLDSSAVNGLGTVGVEYNLDNFRGNLQSTTAQSYLVDYTVLSTGATDNGAVRRVQDRGVFEIQIGKPSLSQYLFLVDNAGGRGGFFPTGARFNGPVHANHDWGFRGSPEFLDTISTADNGAWYYSAQGCNGGTVWIQGDSRPPCTVPVFAKGFTRNADPIELPTTSLSQQGAALGLNPDDLSTLPQTTVCEQLRVRPNCNSDSSIPNGVYLVNDGTNVTGGIYVQGNLSRLTLDGSGRDGTQIYSLEQGGNDWTITIDYAANTTTFHRPDGSVTTYNGAPNGDAALGTGGANGQIYVNGRISDLRGPGRSGDLPDDPPDHPVPSQVLPALALETQLNITATNRIGLHTDLVYECDPTALGDNDYLAAYPRCNLGGALLPTVLGVMSQNEDIAITTATPDDLYLWGSYLAGTAGRGLTVENYYGRGPQGALRLFGGVIQSRDQLRGTIYYNGDLASGYMETFDYDLRFANGVIAPPNFPTVRTFDVQSIVPVALSFYEY